MLPAKLLSNKEYVFTCCISCWLSSEKERKKESSSIFIRESKSCHSKTNKACIHAEVSHFRLLWASKLDCLMATRFIFINSIEKEGQTVSAQRTRKQQKGHKAASSAESFLNLMANVWLWEVNESGGDILEWLQQEIKNQNGVRCESREKSNICPFTFTRCDVAQFHFGFWHFGRLK